MNATLLEDTRRIVLTMVDFLERRNQGILTEAQQTLDAMNPEKRAEFAGFDAATATFVPAALIPKSVIPEGIVGDGTTLSNLDYYFMLSPILFPKTETDLSTVAHFSTQLGDLRANGLSAATAAKLGSALEKLIHTPVRENILHASMDNTDWRPLQEDAPLFQLTTGTGEVVPYQRAVHTPALTEPGAKAYPVFINEAAYQESNMACWVVKDAKFTLY